MVSEAGRCPSGPTAEDVDTKAFSLRGTMAATLFVRRTGRSGAPVEV